jgi:hypothetical protein
MSGLRLFFVAWLLPSWLLACASAAERPPGSVALPGSRGCSLAPGC